MILRQRRQQERWRITSTGCILILLTVVAFMTILWNSSSVHYSDAVLHSDAINPRKSPSSRSESPSSQSKSPSSRSNYSTSSQSNSTSSQSNLYRGKLLPIAQKLHQKANEILNIHGRWENRINGEDDEWIWLQDATAGITWTSGLPASKSSDSTTITTFPSALQLVFYGSSYTRELFLEMERLHFNISTRNTCDNLGTKRRCFTAEEWKNFTLASNDYIPIKQNGDCMPNYHQRSLGSRSRCSKDPCNDSSSPAPWGEGVDIETCGPPGFRLLPEINTTMTMGKDAMRRKVAIGFKTYIHAPATDNLLLQRLQTMGLETPDVAVVEMGYPWGPRGHLQELTSQLPLMTAQEEIDYYVKFVHEVAFPDTIVIWIATCGCEDKEPFVHGTMGIDATRKRVQQSNYLDLAVVLDKRFLCHRKPKQLTAGHGCAGDVLGILARVLFSLLYWIEDELG